MSRFYSPRRKSNIYQPGGREPFKISRSKIDLFLECPRCFYLDRRLGVGRVPSYPFSLNAAVDALLKKEFDAHRAAGTTHPLMKAYGIEAVPFRHEKMEEWRDSLRAGVQYFDPETNLIITGGVDDIWVNAAGELLVVDYKATAKEGEVSLDADWQDGYKRQMEVYQWLLRRNGFKVSETGYFVYVNGRTDREAFDGRLEFEVKVIPYKGRDEWVEKAVKDIYNCLNGRVAPASAPDCDWCRYREAVSEELLEK